ncbi:hypothetical protein WJX74_005352 [Apatococcus lobatus]|uniref:F-box domain-containing protein n=1 Tax=Apatococcus lobatus TaxID=904363 RepID=A0AAW1RSK1_9CHLO
MSQAQPAPFSFRQAAIVAALLPVALSTVRGKHLGERWTRHQQRRPLRVLSGPFQAVGAASRVLRRRLVRLVEPRLKAACQRQKDAAHFAPHLPEILSEEHMQRVETPALVVFSGGTAFNSIAGQLRQLTTRVAHVLPVSDDGGSTAEIVRVLGGPAVGDIRSRCLRLADDTGDEAKAVKELLGHRLSSTNSQEAKVEWSNIVEGEHKLWSRVSDPYKHTIRAFLVNFHTHVLLHTTESFSYRNGSIGNFFFAGARLFFRSLEAAIFLFSRVARIPEGSQVLPAICTEERITLGAELLDGSFIRGQHSISHPPQSESASPSHVDKQAPGPPIAAPIRRIFYLSSEGNGREHEVFPRINHQVLREIAEADAIVYGMGSLYTSICPSLVLPGVAEAIAERSVPKLFLLNGSIDRETSRRAAGPGPMHASDMVQAVCHALNRTCGKHADMRLDHAPSTYITDLLVPTDSSIVIDHDVLSGMGIRHIVEVASTQTASGCLYDPAALVEAIKTVAMSANSSLAELPEHVLVEVAGLLAAPDLAAARLVCKGWRRLFAEFCTSLRPILAGQDSPHWEQLFEGFPSVSTLDLRLEGSGKAASELLQLPAGSTGQLSQVLLSNLQQGTSEAAPEAFLEELLLTALEAQESRPDLSISLEYFHSESTSGSLRRCMFTNAAVQFLVSLPSNVEVTSLVVPQPYSCRLNPHSLQQIFQLTDLRQLRLVLHDVKITDREFKQLSGFTRLESLWFGSCKLVSDVGLKAGLSDLKQLTQLTLVDLSRISDAGSEVIGSLQHLESLTLMKCPFITDASLNIISQLPHLTALQLSNNDLITDKGLPLESKLKEASFRACPLITQAHVMAVS